jgi:hypothetical protein
MLEAAAWTRETAASKHVGGSSKGIQEATARSWRQCQLQIRLASLAGA